MNIDPDARPKESAGSVSRGDTASAPAPGTADSTDRGHAFISYVHEDAVAVDRLQQAFQTAGIRVWRDTDDLWPGENWRAQIRNAIAHDSLAFIACFSSRSAARRRSHQYEEILLAVDQVRQQRPGRSWLFPVRFDDCDIPDLELGAGRRLTSFQQSDLFGPGRDRATERLAAAVQRLLS